MNLEEYRAFTNELKTRLESDERVLGLVAAGSMAETGTVPDEWSDHDFWVIVKPGEQEKFRSDLSWLPDPGGIVFRFRETQHGMKVLYESGHLLEFAVFDPQELQVAKVNRYRMLIDRADLESQLRKIREETLAWSRSSRSDDHYLLGQFLTMLLIAAGRYKRGEHLSGRFYLVSGSLPNLTLLFSKYVSSPGKQRLDDIDPLRRFESVYPEIGEKLDQWMSGDPGSVAIQLLDLAQRELESRIQDFPSAAFNAIRRRLES